MRQSITQSKSPLADLSIYHCTSSLEALDITLNPFQAFNSLLLAMTAYKSIHISWNHNALVDAPWYTYTRTTMTSLLLRDGVLSYFVVLLALLFTAFGCFIQGVSGNFHPTNSSNHHLQWKLVALQSG